MRIDTISLVISVFVSLFLGSAALMRNHRNPLYQKFAFFCFFLFGRDLLCLLKEGSPDLLIPYLWITLAVGPISLSFLGQLESKKRTQRFLQVGYACFLVALWGISISWSSLRILPLLQALAEASLIVPAYLWVSALVSSSQNEPFPREKLRFRYAAWGLVVVVGFHITDTLYFSHLSSVIPLGTLARAVYLVFLFQLFILRELFTWRELLSRGFLFGSVSLILSCIYWLLVSWVDSRPGLFLFNTFIASFAILILFDPLKAGVSRVMKLWFLKRSSHLEFELNKLVHELRGLDPQDLLRKLSTCLCEGLPIESLSLYLLQRGELGFVRVEEQKKHTEEIPCANPLVEYMVLRRGRAFTLDALLSDQEAFYSVQGKKFIEECLAVLKKLSADLVIPFYLDGKILGFVTASLQEGSIVGIDLLKAFSPLTRQLALLLRSAQNAQVSSERDKLVTVGEMAAGLAHEIKNPLGAIQGAAELLLLDPEKETQQEYLKIIQDESHRLSQVLSQFLDFAKPRKQEPESVSDPLRVIEHVASLVLRNNSSLQFHVSCLEPSLALSIDPEILKQVLINLFLNSSQALENIPNAQLSVEIKSIRSLGTWTEKLPLFKMMEGWKNLIKGSGIQWAQINITDNGPGVPPQLLDRVFEPFFTTKKKGTGLGLSLCKRLIESAGGQIFIKTNLTESGTTVVLMIPVYKRAKIQLPEVHYPSWQES